MTGKFITYAQNFEDVMLWRALRDVRHGFYIDVGASWPFSGSVTLAFYERGWRGINLEPDADTFKALVEHRPRDVNLNIAVSDKPGELPMYFVPNTGQSTLNEGEAELRKAEGKPVVVHVVPVSTLASVWSEHVPPGQEVHFLKVDVEGGEREVLEGVDWRSQRPWLVVVEATLPNTRAPSHEQWESLLLEADYEVVHRDGLNRFYLASEHAELRPAFEFPPNWWDQFVPAPQHWAERRAERAEGKARQLEQKLERVRRSWWWRLGRPIRMARRGLRRLRR